MPILVVHESVGERVGSSLFQRTQKVVDDQLASRVANHKDFAVGRVEDGEAGACYGNRRAARGHRLDLISAGVELAVLEGDQRAGQLAGLAFGQMGDEVPYFLLGAV